MLALITESSSRESGHCTHRVGQRDGLCLSSLAVMSFSVIWCKEVSADTVEGVKEKKKKTVRPFFTCFPGVLENWLDPALPEVSMNIPVAVNYLLSVA